MPAGIRVHALQRRDSGRLYLLLIFVSLSDRIQEIKSKLSPIINENGSVSRFFIIFGLEKPQRAQRTVINQSIGRNL